MIYFLALIPATGLTIAGYFAMYLSNRSEGAFRSFGKYLGFWAFTLAGLLLLGSIFAAAHGGRHGPMFDMHGRMHGPWQDGPRFCNDGRPGEPDTGAPNAPPTPGPASPPAR